MAGKKPTLINLKSTSPEGVVRTFKSIPEAARELGFSEAAVKKAKYSNRNRIGEYQLEWLEPKPEKPAFNRLERVKSNKTKNCFIYGEPLETKDKMDHFSNEELNSKGEIIQTHYPGSLYRAAQISGISWNALKNARDKGNRIVYRRADKRPFELGRGTSHLPCFEERRRKERESWRSCILHNCYWYRSEFLCPIARLSVDCTETLHQLLN